MAYYNNGQTFTIEGKNVIFEYGILLDSPYISIKETYTDKDGKTKINYKTGIFQILNNHVSRTAIKALFQNVVKDKKEHTLKITKSGNKAVIFIISATPNSIGMSLREYTQNGAKELNSKDYTIDFREGHSDIEFEFDDKRVNPVIESLIEYITNIERFIVDTKCKLKIRSDAEYSKKKESDKERSGNNNPEQSNKGDADDSDYIHREESSMKAPEIIEHDDIPF